MFTIAEVGVILVILLAALVVLTQIIIPLGKGTPFFPWFRRKHTLTKELTEAEEDVQLAELEGEIAERLEKAKQLRKKREEKEQPPQEQQ